jgi:hypothetical protein
MGWLRDAVGLDPRQEQEIAGTLGDVKSATEYASGLAEAVKTLELGEALRSLAPWWVGPVAEAAGESIPMVKFLVKLAEKLPDKPSPKQIGLLACTLAFQRAAETALLAAGPPENRIPLVDAASQARSRISKYKMEDPEILRGFSLNNPAAHPFFAQALEALRVPLFELGYSEAEVRRLGSRIREGFKENLRDVVSEGALREKFAPFTQWALLGAEEDRAYYALQAHADAQRTAFTESPVLGQEPFALADVYTETDCGNLTWKVIRGDGKPENKIDAFAEKNGGRHPLIATVLAYLGDKKCKEPIIVQGGPGSGKTAFTLRLSEELLAQGLAPIRIRIRDLRIDLPLLSALSNAITESEEIGLERMQVPKPSNALLDGGVFNEAVEFGSARISRFVLILDGWDEVSTAERGYQIQIRELLQRVRNDLVMRRNPVVRVILTGRPSDAVAASNFLADDTPILTMRPYTPDQLEHYVERLARALQLGPRMEMAGAIPSWTIPDTARFAKVFSVYRKQFDANSPGPKTLDVLGQPLLAHLAVRVMAECESESEMGELVSSPTRLYRNLVDLTCGKAGKAAADAGDSPQQARIRGPELRRRLHRTAAAITAWGQESIPFGELVLRARLNDDESGCVTPEALQDRPWTRLMISFYFKGGGEHHGCEFLHKSFREYLFAEGIVEALKDHARQQEGPVPVRQENAYWQDFADDDRDQRCRLSRTLAELLSPQLLLPEVVRHLEDLIVWEIQRSDREATKQHGGEPTSPLSLEGWETARDLLAELWDWWGEGAHLRPQPKRNKKTDSVDLDPPYALELVDMAMQRERNRTKPLPVPQRLITVDAHLGDGLFRLNSLVHYFIAHQRGWSGSWADKETGQRAYQSVVKTGDVTATLFAPSGRSPDFFHNYVARINAAGWTLFPSDATMMGADLENCALFFLIFSGANLRHANLRGAQADYSYFGFADLSEADLSQMLLRDGSRRGSWQGADLCGAKLFGTILHGRDWSEIRGLRAEQLADAVVDGQTRLPPNLQRPRKQDDAE